jgi:hypothetical protein
MLTQDGLSWCHDPRGKKAFMLALVLAEIFRPWLPDMNITE